MANARIFQERKLQLDFVVQKDQISTRISDPQIAVSLDDLSPFSKNFKEKDYPVTRVQSVEYKALIQEQLPFRVRFINKGFSAYGPENPPPIGVAVIGFNNYIL
jgi:hypothetical protein